MCSALKRPAVSSSPGPKPRHKQELLVPWFGHSRARSRSSAWCLGHQAIGEAFGAQDRASTSLIATAKTCPIVHSDDELFDGIHQPRSYRNAVTIRSSSTRLASRSAGGDGDERRSPGSEAIAA